MPGENAQLEIGGTGWPVLLEYIDWLILDAVLMELSAPHPRMTLFEEADLKGRLLQVMEANASGGKPEKLVRLIRKAMTSDEFPDQPNPLYS